MLSPKLISTPFNPGVFAPAELLYHLNHYDHDCQFQKGSVARSAAQTGGISGTVKDLSGAAVPKVAVSLMNQDTNARQTQTTGDAGTYAFPQVLPGRYRLESEAAGFKKFIRADIAGRAFLNMPGLIGKVVGGWQLNGITTVQRGVPLGLTTSSNQTNSLGGGSRPNNNGHTAAISGRVQDRLIRYFDSSVFSQPAFTFGNVARTLPDVRAPGAINFDFSVIKNTRFKERANVQFRAEFFNIANHPNFGSPGTTFGTASFGVISSSSDGRVVQFGLKILF